MPSLTDGEIRRALKQVEQTGKQLSLVDGEGHGTGRLVLVMKPMPTRVTADWMAQQWRDQKRLKKKLGSYPSMSLSKAREVFTRDFADMIQKGRSIKIAGDTRPGTVADHHDREEFLPVACLGTDLISDRHDGRICQLGAEVRQLVAMSPQAEQDDDSE